MTHLEIKLALFNLSETVLPFNLTEANLPEILLPAVQFLHIGDWDPRKAKDEENSCAIDLLEHIIAPLAVKLALNGRRHDYADITKLHFPSLRHLILDGLARGVQPHELATRFPDIERLDCHFPLDIIIHILAMPTFLDESGAPKTLFPKLKALAFKDPGRCSHGGLGVLEDIIKRESSGYPIQKLLVTKVFREHYGPEFMTKLQEHVEVEE